jgi:hypothetical protein
VAWNKRTADLKFCSQSHMKMITGIHPVGNLNMSGGDSIDVRSCTVCRAIRRGLILVTITYTRNSRGPTHPRVKRRKPDRAIAQVVSRRPGFEPRSRHVVFVVDEVTLGQVFSEYFGFPCQFSFHRLLHVHHHLSPGAGTIGQLVADVPCGLSLTPPQDTKKTKPKASFLDGKVGRNRPMYLTTIFGE